MPAHLAWRFLLFECPVGAFPRGELPDYRLSGTVPHLIMYRRLLYRRIARDVPNPAVPVGRRTYGQITRQRQRGNAPPRLGSSFFCFLLHFFFLFFLRLLSAV